MNEIHIKSKQSNEDFIADIAAMAGANKGSRSMDEFNRMIRIVERNYHGEFLRDVRLKIHIFLDYWEEE